MPSLAKRVRRRFTFFLLVFSSIQLPEEPPDTVQYRLAAEETTWDGGKDLSPLLSPQSICYGLLLLALLILGLLSTVDLVFKSVFIGCSLTVHWATAHCRIQRPRKPENGIQHPQKQEIQEDVKVFAPGKWTLFTSYADNHFTSFCKMVNTKLLSRRSDHSLMSWVLTACVLITSLCPTAAAQGSNSTDDGGQGLSNGDVIAISTVLSSAAIGVALVVVSIAAIYFGVKYNKNRRQRLEEGNPLEEQPPPCGNRLEEQPLPCVSVSIDESEGGRVSGGEQPAHQGHPGQPIARPAAGGESHGSGKQKKSSSTPFHKPGLEKPPMIEHINFGIPFLGIDYAWLRRMEASLPNPTVKQILTQWLDGGGLPVTWKSLIQDLRYRGFRQLADEIEVLKGSTSFLEEAMKGEGVEVTVIKVIIVGTAGVGKTCVYHLLMGLPPPDPNERQGTPLGKRPVQVIQITTEGKDNNWTKAHLEELIVEAVPILCKRLKKNAQETENIKEDDSEDTGATGEDKVKEGAQTQEKNEFQKVVEEVVVRLEKLVIDHLSEGNRPSEAHQPPQTLEEEAEKIKLEKEAIYLTDSGGQEAFWDLAPIFMHGSSTIVFVHNLCDKLNKKPLNELHKKGNLVGEKGQRATLTTADAFKLMCQGLESSKSKVIVVGTHKDKYYEIKMEEIEREPIAEKNEMFGNSIPEDSKVYYGDNLIFEVNAMDPEERKKEIVKDLRGKIGALSGQLVKQKEHIPISLYVLQIVLEEVSKTLKRQVFTFAECEAVASELSFNREELIEALRYFDELNLFFTVPPGPNAPPGVVPELVFTSSQVPLDAVTKLVEKRHELLKKREDKVDANGKKYVIDGSWSKFIDKARITLQLLKEPVFQEIYYDIFTEKTFLCLLQDLLIVALVKGEEYFCPALLKRVETGEVDRFLKKKKKTTRVFNFPKGYAPPGVFCCAVCHLISKAGWEIEEKEEVARNQVTFRVNSVSVTLIDKLHFFAVTLDMDDAKLRKDDVKKAMCTRVNENVSSAIVHACANTHKKALCEPSFLCQCSKKPLHTAKLQLGKLVCSEDIKKSTSPNKYQNFWLSKD